MKSLDIRRNLYQEIRQRVADREGPRDRELSRYEKTYQKALSKTWTSVKRQILLGRIEQTNILFLGDFHALNQSQKAHLRLLRSLPRGRKVILAVECLPAKSQAVTDRFLAGDLSDREFLKSVEWKKNWSFPWESYKGLFKWAADRSCSVVGLSPASRRALTLTERDRFAAKKIKELRQKFPEALIVVIFGDLHVCPQHLPKLTEKALGVPISKWGTILYQNQEDIYFELLKKSQEQEVDLVRLSPFEFCVLNVPPWVKWQNYLMYLEKSEDRELQEQTDFSDYVDHFCRMIAKDLDLPWGSSSLAVYTAQEREFWDYLDRLPRDQKKWFEQLIRHEISFVIPVLGIGYLARASVNHAASLAAQAIFFQESKMGQWPFQQPKDFLKLIWIESFVYFGAKLINGSKKTDTLLDIKKALQSAHSQEESKDSLQIALMQKMRELMFLSTGQMETRPFKTPKKSNYLVAARLLGGMLGEKMHYGFRKGLISQKTLANLVQKNLERDRFEAVYYETVSVFESLPESFRSKNDKF